GLVGTEVLEVEALARDPGESSRRTVLFLAAEPHLSAAETLDEGLFAEACNRRQVPSLAPAGFSCLGEAHTRIIDPVCVATGATRPAVPLEHDGVTRGKRRMRTGHTRFQGAPSSVDR